MVGPVSGHSRPGSRFTPVSEPQSTVDEQTRSPADQVIPGQRAIHVLYQIVELRGLEPLSFTLPVPFNKLTDQRKQRTTTSTGVVHRRSKPPHVVQLHRMLQICSTHRSMNGGRRRTQCRTCVPTCGAELGPHPQRRRQPPGPSCAPLVPCRGRRLVRKSRALGSSRSQTAWNPSSHRRRYRRGTGPAGNGRRPARSSHATRHSRGTSGSADQACHGSTTTAWSTPTPHHRPSSRNTADSTTAPPSRSHAPTNSTPSPPSTFDELLVFTELYVSARPNPRTSGCYSRTRRPAAHGQAGSTDAPRR